MSSNDFAYVFNEFNMICAHVKTSVIFLKPAEVRVLVRKKKKFTQNSLRIHAGAAQNSRRIHRGKVTNSLRVGGRSSGVAVQVVIVIMMKASPVVVIATTVNCRWDLKIEN